MTSYRNPILPGFNPDPTNLFHDGSFFIITSTFEFFPALSIYESKDLVGWKLIGHVLTRPSQLSIRACEPSGGIFAPTLRYNDQNGLFYVTVCALHRMKAAVPNGVSGGIVPWRNPRLVGCLSFDAGETLPRTAARILRHLQGSPCTRMV